MAEPGGWVGRVAFPGRPTNKVLIMLNLENNVISNLPPLSHGMPGLVKEAFLGSFRQSQDPSQESQAPSIHLKSSSDIWQHHV